MFRLVSGRNENLGADEDQECLDGGVAVQNHESGSM